MLSHFDITMAEHLGNILNRYVIGKSNRRGERVTCAMERDYFVDPDLCCYFLQYSVAIGDVGNGQYEIRPCNFALVAGDDALRNAAQFDFERRARLLPLLNNP